MNFYKTSKLDITLIIIIIGLSMVSGWLYFNKTVVVSSTSEQELRLRDSISILQKEIETSVIRQTYLQHAYDSMLLVEPQIIYRTRETIKFIYGDATPDQLDSIIRTNWKTHSGHN